VPAGAITSTYRPRRTIATMNPTTPLSPQCPSQLSSSPPGSRDRPHNTPVILATRKWLYTPQHPCHPERPQLTHPDDGARRISVFRAAIRPHEPRTNLSRLFVDGHPREQHVHLH
jgi:hypothetical protein